MPAAIVRWLTLPHLVLRETEEEEIQAEREKKEDRNVSALVNC